MAHLPVCPCQLFFQGANSLQGCPEPLSHLTWADGGDTGVLWLEEPVPTVGAQENPQEMWDPGGVKAGHGKLEARVP